MSNTRPALTSSATETAAPVQTLPALEPEQQTLVDATAEAKKNLPANIIATSELQSLPAAFPQSSLAFTSILKDDAKAELNKMQHILQTNIKAHAATKAELEKQQNLNETLRKEAKDALSTIERLKAQLEQESTQRVEALSKFTEYTSTAVQQITQLQQQNRELNEILLKVRSLQATQEMLNETKSNFDKHIRALQTLNAVMESNRTRGERLANQLTSQLTATHYTQGLMVEFTRAPVSAFLIGFLETIRSHAANTCGMQLNEPKYNPDSRKTFLQASPVAHVEMENSHYEVIVDEQIQLGKIKEVASPPLSAPSLPDAKLADSASATALTRLAQHEHTVMFKGSTPTAAGIAETMQMLTDTLSLLSVAGPDAARDIEKTQQQIAILKKMQEKSSISKEEHQLVMELPSLQNMLEIRNYPFQAKTSLILR